MSVDREQFDTPRPSTDRMQARLEAELSSGSPVLYTLLMVFALSVAAAVGSLWLTEPGLPTRTHVAFGAIAFGALAWAGFFGWSLSRRQVLLGRDRVRAARIALACTGAFTLGAVAVAVMTPDLRVTGLAAAGFGALLLAIALRMQRRAVRRHAELVRLRDRLSREIAPGGSTA